MVKISLIPLGVGESDLARAETITDLTRQLDALAPEAPTFVEPDPATFAPLDVFAPELDPESGLTWDEPMLRGVQAFAERESDAHGDASIRGDVRAVLHDIVEAEARVRSGEWRKVTAEECDEFLIRKHGQAKAGWIFGSFQEAVNSMGGPALKQNVAERTGFHPQLVEYIAAIGDKIQNARTARGWAREQFRGRKNAPDASGADYWRS